MKKEEGNKLIAEFMGWKYSKSGKTVRKDSYSSPYRIKDIQYHSSWNWLMPVVGKIESLGYCVSIFRGCCDIEERELYEDGWEEIANGGGQPKIVSAWKSVTQFIQWYNSQSKTDNNDE